MRIVLLYDCVFLPYCTITISDFLRKKNNQSDVNYMDSCD